MDNEQGNPPVPPELRLVASDDGPLSLRIGLRGQGGLRSAVYRLWSDRTKGKARDDIYIASRSIAGALKVSLHASGKRQVSFTRQYADREPGKRIPVPENRHIISWDAPHWVADGVALEYILRFPEGQLRKLRPVVREHTVEWIDVPTPAPGLDLLLLAFEPGQDYNMTFQGTTPMLGHGLPDGRYIMLVAKKHDPRPTVPGGDESRVGLPTANEVERGFDEGHRALLFFTTDQGVHGFADYAVDNGRMTITA